MKKKKKIESQQTFLFELPSRFAFGLGGKTASREKRKREERLSTVLSRPFFLLLDTLEHLSSPPPHVFLFSAGSAQLSHGLPWVKIDLLCSFGQAESGSRQRG